jgi:hypothetical protein
MQRVRLRETPQCLLQDGNIELFHFDNAERENSPRLTLAPAPSRVESECLGGGLSEGMSLARGDRPDSILCLCDGLHVCVSAPCPDQCE